MEKIPERTATQDERVMREPDDLSFNLLFNVITEQGESSLGCLVASNKPDDSGQPLSGLEDTRFLTLVQG